ncbi:MAG: hypothetical protein ABH816_04385 [Candidatus Levyibacteriota bacterium]
MEEQNIPQPPISPIENQPKPETKSLLSPKWILIIIVLLVIVILSAGVYLLGKSSNNSVSKSTWKTYNDPIYEYSFKYPIDFKAYPSEKIFYSSDTQFDKITNFKIRGADIGTEIYGPGEEDFKRDPQVYTRWAKADSGLISKLVLPSGYIAKTYVDAENYPYAESLENATVIIDYTKKNENMRIKIWCVAQPGGTRCKNLLTAILSTFKFTMIPSSATTNASPIPNPTTNRNIYKDAGGGFSLQNPKNMTFTEPFGTVNFTENNFNASFQYFIIDVTEEKKEAEIAIKGSNYSPTNKTLANDFINSKDANSLLLAYEKYGRALTCHLEGIFCKIENYQFLTISGYPAMQYSYEFLSRSDDPLTGQQTQILAKGRIYIFSFSELNNSFLKTKGIFDQIISTFKLTDQIVLPTQNQTACTQEAKLCPDGKTTVGRTGSNCEFVCP